jgi:3-oxoacyl-[acyl-carrier-protein] synthase II
MGAITPLGSDLESLWSALCEGRSAVRRVTAFPVNDQPTQIAAEVPDFDPTLYVDRKQARHLDRCAQFAVAAARLALADSGLAVAGEAEEFGVCIGTGAGCLGVIEEQVEVLRSGGPRRTSPFLAAMMLPNMPAAQVSIQLGLQGPVQAISTACATGADNIAAGVEMIRSGRACVVLAGGADAAITPLGLAGFASARSLSRNNAEPEKASRPFDRRRDGFVMGEGAGVVVLEELAAARARGARVWAEVLGHGSTSDAHHITAPREDGAGLVRAIRLALRSAELTPADVDYVNAHGTSTQLNDKVETAALKAALGERAHQIPVNSTKSMIGHLLGAAGAVELIVTALSIRHQYVHLTANLEEPDPDCDLDYVAGSGRRCGIKVALSNSLAFGGHNACLVLGAP